MNAGRVLRRQCACGAKGGACACGPKKRVQREATASQAGPATAPPVVHDVLRASGKPLDPATRADLEPRFGHDLGRVRIHDDAQAARSADAVLANAYTVGEHVVFASGRYDPWGAKGRRLLAHELTHVVQQRGGEASLDRDLAVGPASDPREREADLVADQVTRGPLRRALAPLGGTRRLLQREGVEVRSPVAEELITQATDVSAAISGRPLTRDEIRVARTVFGASVDYAPVRILISPISGTTVGNVIRMQEGYSLRNQDDEQTFIHEMTHVWQYQHGGTSYISLSLGPQLVAAAGRGNRNFAYDYVATPGRSFFEYTPEQQASIVENTFAMRRDSALVALPPPAPPAPAPTFQSNHMGADGFRLTLSAADRAAEITRELPIHETLVAQMRAALPRTQADLLLLRASDLMVTPGAQYFTPTPEREIAPLRPLVEVRW